MTDIAEILEELGKRASAYPDVALGTSCKKTSYKVKKKAFAYLGEGKGGVSEMMIKLSDSLSQAQELSESHPDSYKVGKVGKTGWVTIRFQDAALLESELLTAWLEESYQLSTS